MLPAEVLSDIAHFVQLEDWKRVNFTCRIFTSVITPKIRDYDEMLRQRMHEFRKCKEQLMQSMSQLTKVLGEFQQLQERRMNILLEISDIQKNFMERKNKVFDLVEGPESESSQPSTSHGSPNKLKRKSQWNSKSDDEASYKEILAKKHRED
ncbi:hypothetical protein DdX_00429 [Ditylenchus destructor]|uniref:F-box domain-containing protein n=1 Tax=Ditylenchus destructor TaxID=166010 RepID=A0AAD4NDR0_9BILA|nr:hypothetical protein DdX_00429 [Ditylenchus destructor]